MQEPTRFYNVEEDWMEKKIVEMDRYIQLLELRGDVHAGICKVQPYLFMPAGKTAETSRFSHFKTTATKQHKDRSETIVDEIKANQIRVDQEDTHCLLIYQKELQRLKKKALNLKDGTQYLRTHPPDFRDCRSHSAIFQWLHNLVVLRQQQVFLRTLKHVEDTVDLLLPQINALDNTALTRTYGSPLGIEPSFEAEDSSKERENIEKNLDTLEGSLSTYLS